MGVMRKATICFAAALAAAGATGSAWALGGGGTAPGGPLSGGIRPACNGYNMDGMPTRISCDGLSVDERRAAGRPLEHAR